MNRLLCLLCLLFVASLLSASAHAQFVLVQTGGTFRSNATNIAAAANGATAIGQDELDAGVHYITNINNGTYGNSSSWIGLNASSTWIGVIFGSATNIGSFAFGRDNTGSYFDRSTGTYTFEYTTQSVTAGTAAAATWIAIGTLNYGATPPLSPEARHLYDLSSPLAGVTAFRIVTQGSIDSSGQAIDELEVYATTAAVPEPSTYAALFGAVALGFAAWRRRRTA